MKVSKSVSVQEIIVVCLTALLFVAQPFKNTPNWAFFALAVAGVLVLITNKSLAKFVGVKQFGLIVLFIGVPGLFSLWSTVSVYETGKFILFVPVFYFAGVTIYSLFQNEKLLPVVTSIIAITSIGWIIYALIQYFTGSDLLGNSILTNKPVTGPFTNSHLGMLLSVTLPITLKWLVRFGWSAQIVYFLVLAFVLYQTEVRTDGVTYIVALALFYFFYFPKNRGRLLFVVFYFPKNRGRLLFVVCLVTTCWFAVTNIEPVKNKWDAIVSVVKNQDDFRNDLNFILSGRLDIWEASWKMFKEHPVTGIGAKCWGDAYEEYKPTEDEIQGKLIVKDGFHAHHVWISMLAEFGIIGFLGLAGAVVYLVLLTCKSRSGFNLYTYPWMLSFLLIVNPFNSMPPIFKMWWIPIVLLVIVTQLVEIHRKDSNDADNSEA